MISVISQKGNTRSYTYEVIIALEQNEVSIQNFNENVGFLLDGKLRFFSYDRE